MYFPRPKYIMLCVVIGLISVEGSVEKRINSAPGTYLAIDQYGNSEVVTVFYNKFSEFLEISEYTSNWYNIINKMNPYDYSWTTKELIFPLLNFYYCTYCGYCTLYNYNYNKIKLTYMEPPVYWYLYKLSCEFEFLYNPSLYGSLEFITIKRRIVKNNIIHGDIINVISNYLISGTIDTTTKHNEIPNNTGISPFSEISINLFAAIFMYYPDFRKYYLTGNAKFFGHLKIIGNILGETIDDIDILDKSFSWNKKIFLAMFMWIYYPLVAYYGAFINPTLMFTDQKKKIPFLCYVRQEFAKELCGSGLNSTYAFNLSLPVRINNLHHLNYGQIANALHRDSSYLYPTYMRTPRYSFIPSEICFFFNTYTQRLVIQNYNTPLDSPKLVFKYKFNQWDDDQAAQLLHQYFIAILLKDKQKKSK